MVIVEQALSSIEEARALAYILEDNSPVDFKDPKPQMLDFWCSGMEKLSSSRLAFLAHCLSFQEHKWNGYFEEIAERVLNMVINKRGEIEYFPRMVAAGLSLDRELPSDEDTTVLIWYARRGDATIVNCLISLSIDVNYCNHIGESPLHHACKNEHVKVAWRLLEAGADPDLEDEYGTSPLDIAQDRDNRSLIRMLNRGRKASGV